METKKTFNDHYEPMHFKERTSTKNRAAGEEAEPNLGPPEIPHDEFQIEQFLGEGAFGKVYKGTCRGKTVAIKEPIKQDLSEDELQAFEREVKTMSRIFHPNIVLYLGGCTRPDRSKCETIKICMEYCETDLEGLLRKDRKLKKLISEGQPIHDHKYKPLTLKDRLQLAKDAALGLNWLHGINSITHGDLKTANLLIDSNGRVKVGDFGFSKIRKTTDLTKDPYPVGTPVYMAPEVMLCKPYDAFKADVYSFGYILWEIATSQKLFPQYTKWSPFKKAITEEKVRPPLSKEIPSGFAQLMQRCWDENPANRPSLDEIVFRIDECLVDACIQDVHGRAFWKKHFLQPKQVLDEKVNWSDFKEVLAAEIGVSPDTLKPVKQLLAVVQNEVHEDKAYVTMEHFNKMIFTFGYFFLPKAGPKVIQEMADLLQQPWFHMDIDRTVAVTRLAAQPEGTWLLRLRDPFDPAHPGHPFAISQVKDKKPYQRLIKVDPTQPEESRTYTVSVTGKDRSFKTLIELLQFKDLKLSKAAPKELQHDYDAEKTDVLEDFN